MAAAASGSLSVLVATRSQGGSAAFLITSETGQAVESQQVARQTVTFFFLSKEGEKKESRDVFLLRGAAVLIGLDIHLRDRRGATCGAS